MKKLALIIALMLMALCLTGCQARNTVAPTKLNENEQSIFGLLGPYAAMFDLNMTKDVRSVHVNLYTLEYGRWLPLVDGGRPFAEPSERIVLSVNVEMGKLILTSGGSTVSFKQEGLGQEDAAIMTSMLNEKTTLNFDEEVPLFMYVEGNEDAASASIGSYFHPEGFTGQERVYVLTVMVSRNDVN